MNEKFFDLKKEKQDRMLNAALKIFALHGYRHASTDDMVKEAGISKGLLFHYFGSKAGLYEFIYGYSVKYMLMELTGAVSLKETDFFTLRGQIEKARYTMLKNFPYMALFLKRARREASEEVRELIVENRQAYETAYAAIYERADFSGKSGVPLQELKAIMDYTLDGILEEAMAQPDFTAEAYYKEALHYLDVLRGGFGRMAAVEAPEEAAP